MSTASGCEAAAPSTTNSTLLHLISQYPIITSIAADLTIDDIINLSVTSKDVWSCLRSTVNDHKLSKGVSSHALTCGGLSIQIKPIDADDDAYHMPCKAKRGTEIRRCQGCGVGCCNTCRFRVTHCTILTMPMKRHWVFPSKTKSGNKLVTDNMECLVASFARYGHGSHTATKGPCDCTYEERWLKRWLCVACLNRDLYAVEKA